MLWVSEKTSTRWPFRPDEFSRKITTVGVPSLFSPALLGYSRFVKAYHFAGLIYRKFNPHAVLGMGGFTSTAPVLAGDSAAYHVYSRIECVPGKQTLDRAGVNA